MSVNQNATISMRLTGARQVTLEATGTAAAIDKIAAATTRASLAQETATRKSFLYGQAMFTLRRVIYGTTLALGAGAAAVVGFGLKFNSTMEQNVVAFTHFLGSGQAATAFIDKLFDLAAHTPFEFQGLATSTKRLLAFGYTADTAYRTMVDIGDAISGLGTGQEGIDRLTLAFGQMRTNGRILGGELRQLGEANISARKYLQEAFNLTPDQMSNIGRLQIPAEQGIEAILRGMEKEFGGFAEKQAGTFQGLLSTISDYSSKLFGTITKPLFDRLLRKELPALASATEELSKGFSSGGWLGMVKTLDDMAGGSGNLVRAWNLLTSYGRNLGIIFKDSILPGLLPVLKAMGIMAFVILTALAPAFQFLADHTTILKVVTLGLATAFIILKTNALLAAIAETRLVKAARLLIGTTKAAIIWMKREGAALIMTKVRMFAATIATSALMAATWLYNTAVGAAIVSTIAFTAALLTNPITWIVLGLAAIALGLYILIFHFDKVKAAAKTAFDWINSHSALVVILFGPIGFMVVTIVKGIKLVMDHLDSLVSKAKSAWKWTNKIWDAIPGSNLVAPVLGAIPHASGGMMGRAGLSLVGEQGPEVLSLPAGATIKPADQVKLDPSHQGMVSVALTSIIQLNRREIARAVQEYNLEQGARA